MTLRKCSLDCCDRPHHANGYCNQHNRRARLNGGDPLAATPIRGRADEMFWTYVDQSGGPDACWPWTGGRTRGGYGAAANGRGGSTSAHRRALELSGRAAPPRTPVDHTCHDPRVCPPGECAHRLCCNPAHLEVVTYAENWRRGGLALGVTRAL